MLAATRARASRTGQYDASFLLYLPSPAVTLHYHKDAECFDFQGNGACPMLAATRTHVADSLV